MCVLWIISEMELSFLLLVVSLTQVSAVAQVSPGLDAQRSLTMPVRKSVLKRSKCVTSVYRY